MRIGVVSYPMLWQRTGGLQIQIRKLISHLNSLGVNVRLFDTLKDRLSDYDIIHIFAAINGNHRIVEECRAKGIKVVMNPGVQPDPWCGQGWRFRAAREATALLSRYELHTTFDEVKIALDLSDHIIALSHKESEVICELYGQAPEKLSVVPNGIGPHFFAADPAPFRQRFSVPEPFVLVVGSISAYKNQLGVVKATAEAGLPVVLIGPEGKAGYLRQCLDAGGDRVHYLGVMDHDDPLLASAYAAAAVTVLASKGETFGLTAVESLAAGTPAIITANNGLGLPPNPPLLSFVPHGDQSTLRTAIMAAVGAGPNGKRCQHMVRHLGWKSVAEEMTHIYSRLGQFQTSVS